GEAATRGTEQKDGMRPAPSGDRYDSESPPRGNLSQPARLSLDAMLRMDVFDKNDGSHRLYAACCPCIEHDLSDTEALACGMEYARLRPFPIDWSTSDVLRRLRDAEHDCKRGVALPLEPVSLRRLMSKYPELRPPVICDLLRQGETMNVIAAPKSGKSWLV